jgi:hypothetical protein
MVPVVAEPPTTPFTCQANAGGFGTPVTALNWNCCPGTNKAVVGLICTIEFPLEELAQPLSDTTPQARSNVTTHFQWAVISNVLKVGFLRRPHGTTNIPLLRLSQQRCSNNSSRFLNGWRSQTGYLEILKAAFLFREFTQTDGTELAQQVSSP